MSKPAPLYLGLSADSAATVAAIVDAGGDELGRGRGEPCDIVSCDDGQLRRSLCGAVQAALSATGLADPPLSAGVCAGVPGLAAIRRRTAVGQILAERVRSAGCHIAPDFAVAWWGASRGQPSLAAIAGSGSVVYGQNDQGTEARLDGRGFLLGDRGSAFWLGRAALSRTLARLDSGRGVGAFEHRLLDYLGAADGDALARWAYEDFRPARVVGLADAVMRWADDGDPGARVYVGAAALVLESLVRTARQRLGLPADAPLYRLGGLWCASRWLRDRFEDRYNAGLEQAGARPLDFAACEPAGDAAYGAALLAAHRGALA